MSPGEKSDCGEILQILVVSNDVYGSSRTFEIMLPYSEGFEDGQKFFVMGVVVQFRDSKGVGMEGHWVDLTILQNYGKNCCDSIIGSVSFNNKQSVGNETGKDWSSRESFFKGIEGFTACIVEIPKSRFAG